MKTKTFINELGNRVTIRVKRTRSKAINSKTKDEIIFHATDLAISGSTAKIEGYLTMQESLELYELLHVYLESIGKLSNETTSTDLPLPIDEPPTPVGSPVKKLRKKKVIKKPVV